MYGQQKKDFLSTLDIAVLDIENYASIFGYNNDEEYLYYLEKVKSLKYIFAREMSMDENDRELLKNSDYKEDMKSSLKNNINHYKKLLKALENSNLENKEERIEQCQHAIQKQKKC